MRLRGRVAVVTGASRGIGAALAARLAEAGCRLALIARSEQELMRCAGTLRAGGAEAEPFVCDLANRAALERCFERILARYGHVDLLFNNAGVGRFGRFLDMTLEDVTQPIDVPTTAAVVATRLVAPSMVERGEGEIVNIVSPMAYFELPYTVPYTTARVALLGFTRALAEEFDGTGVKVRAVCPAWVDTGYLRRNASEPGWLPRVSRWLPLHSADEVATRMLATLGSKRCEHMLSGRLRVLAWAHRHFPRTGNAALKFAGLYQPAASSTGRGLNAMAVTIPTRNRPGANEWTNWEESIDLKAAVVVFPRSVDEVVNVLKDSARYPSPVRPAGSRHTTTHCGVTDGGTLLVMRHMERIISIDKQAMTVTCEAGVLYIDVAKVLEREGLQFYVNVEIGNLTMGSAATTGTKDASMPDELGQVCSYCTGVRMVRASGEVEEIRDSDDNPALMQAVRSSYGLFGVIVEVTFKVKPIQPMAVWHRTYTLDELEQALPDLRRDGVSIMYYLYPFLDRVTVEFRRYRNQPGFRPNRWMWKLRNAAWKTYVPALSRLVTRYVPSRAVRALILDVSHRLLQIVQNKLLRSDSTVASDQIIRYPEHKGLSAYTFSIWAFPEERIMPIMRAFYAFSRDHERQHGFRCDLLNVGYRIAADQKSLFSYSFDGAVMTLDPVTTGSPGWDEFLVAYNDFCSEHGGVPLFNQSKWLTRAQVRKAFGQRIDRLWRFKAEYDPNDRLLNDYFRGLFSPNGD